MSQINTDSNCDGHDNSIVNFELIKGQGLLLSQALFIRSPPRHSPSRYSMTQSIQAPYGQRSSPEKEEGTYVTCYFRSLQVSSNDIWVGIETKPGVELSTKGDEQ